MVTSTLVQRDAAAGRMAASRQQQVLLFTTIVVAAAVFLQRFGLPTGGKPLNIVGPIGLGFAAVGLLRGTLTFSRIRLSLFLLLCTLALLGMAYHQIYPGRFQIGTNLQFLLQFLVLTSFATLSFTEPVPEREFFRRATAVLTLVTIAGIIQFAVQLVGIQLFSFRGIVPNALLFEDGYNLQIPAGFGNLFKSNGFFMVEPSVFSQMMALALIFEILVLKRNRVLALFAGGLLLSMAGTGWIVLAAFVGTLAFSMGRRGIMVSAVTLAMLGLLVTTVAVLAPDLTVAFTNRLDEVARPGTSGHLRFVTPFWLLDDTLTQEPVAALLGIGGAPVSGCHCLTNTP